MAGGDQPRSQKAYSVVLHYRANLGFGLAQGTGETGQKATDVLLHSLADLGFGSAQ
jgi:hypothetical protein